MSLPQGCGGTETLRRDSLRGADEVSRERSGGVEGGDLRMLTKEAVFELALKDKETRQFCESCVCCICGLGPEIGVLEK